MSQRIAFVGPFGFHPNKTLRRRALSLAKPLARRGYEVALFMPPWQTPAEADKTWQEDGAKTATQRANEIWKSLLQDYEKPPIDPAIEEELQAYMAKRKQELINV